MNELHRALGEAWHLIAGFDSDLAEIVQLSLQVSVSAVAVGALVAMPLGAWLATSRFFGRGILITLFNALMGLPPVVVGLMVYLMLSSSGPLGALQLLYTPGAMLIAQFILVLPIMVALTHRQIAALHDEYTDQLRLFALSDGQRLLTLLFEARFSLVTIVLAGFGRAIAEVGAVLIVGGNINHVTRVMTTTIALETSRGNLALALGLGMVLLLIALGVNTLLMLISGKAERRYES